jgi:lipase (class 3)
MSATAYASSTSKNPVLPCNPSAASHVDPLPSGFDVKLGYLLGLCCNAANDQYTTYVTTTDPIPNDPIPFDPKNWGIKTVAPKPWDPDFTEITAQGYKATTHVNLSVWETNDTLNWVEIPAGFIVQLDPTDTTGTNKSMIVIAFHGTQNNYELNAVDFDLTPADFSITKYEILGSVHGGFFKQYAGYQGNGDLIDRTPGSLAQQIGDYISSQGNTNLPVKVTGHSLGGALATLCAMDIACLTKKYKFKFESISMYSLAGPRVGDAKTDPKDVKGVATFVSNYQQYVPTSYRIVNTLDPIPNSPTALFPPPKAAVQFPPPPYNPTNACAHVLGDKEAIAVGIVNANPRLDQNVVSFTDANTVNDQSAQDCQSPHSCPAVYVPFLKKLATGR